MRSFAGVLIALFLFGVALVPAQAQTPINQGVLEFENAGVIANMTYTGTWTTTTSYSTGVRSTSASGAEVQFTVIGRSLVIWRFMRPTGNASSMNVCVGAVPAGCTLVSNTSVHPDGYFESYVVSLPSPTTNIITIQWVSGAIFLDKFMILGDASLYLTAIVPTATILPSSTPAFTATPGPSPTPAPSSTPAPTTTPMSLIWALDPAKSYGDANGQITSVEYTASAADVHIANLLTFLVLSVWGFFLFGVFVLVKYRVDKK